MAMRRLSCFLALGTTTVRTPLLSEALTPSCSTRVGNWKDRENSPTLRSEIQYLNLGCCCFGCSVVAGLEISVVVVAGVGAAVLLPSSTSSSTVAWKEERRFSADEVSE